MGTILFQTGLSEHDVGASGRPGRQADIDDDGSHVLQRVGAAYECWRRIAGSVGFAVTLSTMERLMNVSGWMQIVVVLALVVGFARPLGHLIADVFEGRRTLLSPVLGPIERSLYRLAGVEPTVEQNWLAYTLSMLGFAAGCFGLLYAVQRLQNWLPLNPQGFDAVSPALAFNTAISFITNANWQAYGGETTKSHLTQMVGLTSNNFLDSAVATALAIAVVRSFARNSSTTIGNFWVDLTRATLYRSA
jgi:potassium-transporting ATPase potassium-binding subunit